MLKLVLITFFGVLVLSQAQPDLNFNFHIGDFNNDGCDDILQQKLVDANKNAVTLAYYYPNKRLIKFFLSEDFSLAGNFVNLLVGHFNGDGKDDILRQEKGSWADDRLGTAQLLLSSTNLSTFDKIEMSEDYLLRGDNSNLYIGDFNGDGNDDILRQEKGVWDDDKVGAVYMLLSDGAGGFTKVDLSEYFYMTGDYTNLFIGDFNGDGKDDILRQEKDAADDDKYLTACLLLSHDNNTFIQIVLPEEFDLHGDYINLFIGDFNGDGNDDFLRQEKDWADYDKVNTANVFLSDGQGAFRKIVLAENFTLEGSWTSLYVGDFNGDGKDDILRQERLGWSEDRLGTAHLLLSTGTDDVFAMIPLPEDLNIGGNGKLYVGDFNGDGNDDFIHDDGGSTPKVFYSNGVDGFTRN